MIRILHVFGCMDRGGSETMVMELYRNIDRTKIQFDFVVHTEKKCAYDDEILSMGGRIFSIPSFSCKNALNYKKAWKKLISEHGEWRIIHGHVRSTASIYLAIAKKLGRYTIAHSHSISSGKGFSAIIKNVLQKGIKADYYLACSKAAGLWLFGQKIVNSKSFSVLPNAIDTSKFFFDPDIRNRVRDDLVCKDSFVIGHIGSFYDVKNHAFLLKIFEAIIDLSPSSKLLLVGDGYLKQSIEESVDKMALNESVLFAGTRTDINELLQAMDVFVFPSKFEGLGIAGIEAQATGLPVIMSDRVPKEAVLVEDLVTVKSLEETPQSWAKTVLSMAQVKRYSRQKEISEKGYDILSTSKWIEEFYLERNQIC